MESMPKNFKTTGHGKLQWTALKLLQKGQKNLMPMLLWSDYKSHNTIKFLTGIGFPIHIVAEQVANSFVVRVDFLTAWIVMFKLWQIEDFR